MGYQNGSNPFHQGLHTWRNTDERTVEKEEEAVCGLWAKTSDPTYHSQNLSTGKLYFLMVKPWFPVDFPLNSPIESQILSL